jgi:hypothetical protein
LRISIDARPERTGSFVKILQQQLAPSGLFQSPLWCEYQIRSRSTLLKAFEAPGCGVPNAFGKARQVYRTAFAATGHLGMLSAVPIYDTIK